MKLDSRTLFRTIAIAEAVTWGGLLIGMYVKWIAQTSEAGVKLFGPIHGVIVLCYLLTVFFVRSTFRWDVRTFLLAIFASVPPFGTLAFEIWADRRGLLTTVGSSCAEETAPAAESQEATRATP